MHQLHLSSYLNLMSIMVILEGNQSVLGTYANFCQTSVKVSCSIKKSLDMCNPYQAHDISP